MTCWMWLWRAVCYMHTADTWNTHSFSLKAYKRQWLILHCPGKCISTREMASFQELRVWLKLRVRGKVLGVQERSLAMFLKCCCCCICFLVGFIIFFLIGDHDCCCLFFMLLQHICRCCRCSCFRLCLCLLWWLLFLLLFLLFFLLLLFLFKLPFTKLCYYQSLSGDSPNLADRILPGGSQSLAPQIGNTGDRKKSMSLFFLHCTQWSPTKLACAVKKL